MTTDGGCSRANGLLQAERRGRLSASDVADALAAFSALAFRLDAAADVSSLVSVAREHRLTVYDAAYLELAQRERVALATLDAHLAAACRAAGVHVIGSA